MCNIGEQNDAYNSIAQTYSAVLQHTDDRVEPPEVGAICFDGDVERPLTASS